MFIQERIFTVDEQDIIFRIRQLISDEKEVFVDEVNVVPNLPSIQVSGSIYTLEEPKGYPQELYINGVEYGTTTTGSTAVDVLSYKMLKFVLTAGVGPLQAGKTLTIIYDHFRNSDVEIINTYDVGAYTYLVNQCGLDEEGDIPIDLLVLATAFIFLTKDIHKLSSEAVELRDSDSQFISAGATGGVRNLMDLLKLINSQLLDSLNTLMKCKMMRLPIYKVE